MPNHMDDLGFEPIVAAVNRSELVKKQLRDRKGRWVEMGADAKLKSAKTGEWLNGTIDGIEGEYAIVKDIKKPDGTPVADLGKVHYSNLEMLEEKADLDDIGEPGPAKAPAAADAPPPVDPPSPGAAASDPGEEPDSYGFDKPEDWEWQGTLEDPNGDEAFVFNTAAGNRVLARTRGSMYGEKASDPFAYAFAVYKGNTDTPFDQKHSQSDFLGAAQNQAGVPALEKKVDGETNEKVDRYSTFITAQDQIDLESSLTTLEQMFAENSISEESPEFDDLYVAMFDLSDGMKSDEKIGKSQLHAQISSLRDELQKIAGRFEEGSPEAAKLSDTYKQLKKVDPEVSTTRKATIPGAPEAIDAKDIVDGTPSAPEASIPAEDLVDDAPVDDVPGEVVEPSAVYGPATYGETHLSSDLTDAESKAIEDYALGFHWYPNGILRGDFGKHEVSAKDVARGEGMVENLTSLLDKSELTGPKKLYRVLRDGSVVPPSPGEFADKGFISFSDNLDNAKNFLHPVDPKRSVILEVDVPEGTSAFDVNAYLGIDDEDLAESEFLLPPQSFSVVSDGFDENGVRYLKLAQLVKDDDGTTEEPGAAADAADAPDSADTGAEGGVPEGAPGADGLGAGPGDGDAGAPEGPGDSADAGVDGDTGDAGSSVAPELTDADAEELSETAVTNVFEILPPELRGQSGDGYFNKPGDPVTLWGKYGAAGALIRHVDDDGTETFLLVQRGPSLVGKNQGKWQLPGGALDEKENDYQGAARELQEELSPPEGFLDNLTPVGEVNFQHPSGWHYNNIAANSSEKFDLLADGTETGGAGWFTREEISDLPLHPALEKNIDSIFGQFTDEQITELDEQFTEIKGQPETDVVDAPSAPEPIPDPEPEIAPVAAKYNEFYPAESLSSGEQAALTLYGYAPGYKLINPFLHHDKHVFDSSIMAYRPATAQEVVKAEEAVKNLDTAFEKGKELDHPVLVYRRSGAELLTDGNMEGQSFTNLAYTSTQTSLTGYGYGYETKPVRWEITLPTGTKALPGNAHENEVLLPRNGKFNVTSDTTSGGVRTLKVTFDPTGGADDDDQNELPVQAEVEEKAATPDPPVTTTLTGGDPTPEEMDALDKYTSVEHIDINNGLRSGADLGSLQGPVDALDALIGRSTVDTDTVVYRGVANHGEFDEDGAFDSLMSKFEPGAVVQDLAYVSTTRDKDIADKFSTGGEGSGAVFAINLPAGSNAYDASHPDSDEQELILPRGTRLHIDSIEDMPDGRKLVSATVVNDGADSEPDSADDFDQWQKAVAEGNITSTGEFNSYKFAGYDMAFHQENDGSWADEDGNVITNNDAIEKLNQHVEDTTPASTDEQLVPDLTSEHVDYVYPVTMDMLPSQPTGTVLVTSAGHRWTKKADGSWKNENGPSDEASLQMSFKWGDGDENELYVPKQAGEPAEEKAAADLVPGDRITSSSQLADLPEGTDLNWSNGAASDAVITKSKSGLWVEFNGEEVSIEELSEDIANGDNITLVQMGTATPDDGYTPDPPPIAVADADAALEHFDQNAMNGGDWDTGTKYHLDDGGSVRVLEDPDNLDNGFLVHYDSNGNEVDRIDLGTIYGQGGGYADAVWPNKNTADAPDTSDGALNTVEALDALPVGTEIDTDGGTFVKIGPSDWESTDEDGSGYYTSNDFIEEDASDPVISTSPAAEPDAVPSGGVPIMPFKEIGTDANGDKYVSTPDGQHIMVGTVVRSKTDGTEAEVVKLENNGKYVRIAKPGGGTMGRTISTLDVIGGNQPVADGENFSPEPDQPTDDELQADMDAELEDLDVSPAASTMAPEAPTSMLDSPLQDWETSMLDSPLQDWEKELLGYVTSTDTLEGAPTGTTMKTTNPDTGTSYTWVKGANGKWSPTHAPEVAFSSHLFTDSIEKNGISDLTYPSPPMPDDDPFNTNDAPDPDPALNLIDTNPSDLPDVPYGTVGVDAEGNKFVYASDGKPMKVGTVVTSKTDGMTGAVTTVENNGKYVRVQRADGKIVGRSIKTLTVNSGDSNPTPDDDATPTTDPGGSNTDTPSPDTDADPFAVGSTVGSKDIPDLPVGTILKYGHIRRIKVDTDHGTGWRTLYSNGQTSSGVKSDDDMQSIPQWTVDSPLDTDETGAAPAPGTLVPKTDLPGLPVGTVIEYSTGDGPVRYIKIEDNTSHPWRPLLKNGTPNMLKPTGTSSFWMPVTISNWKNTPEFVGIPAKADDTPATAADQLLGARPDSPDALDDVPNGTILKHESSLGFYRKTGFGWVDLSNTDKYPIESEDFFSNGEAEYEYVYVPGESTSAPKEGAQISLIGELEALGDGSIIQMPNDGAKYAKAAGTWHFINVSQGGAVTPDQVSDVNVARWPHLDGPLRPSVITAVPKQLAPPAVGDTLGSLEEMQKLPVGTRIQYVQTGQAYERTDAGWMKLDPATGALASTPTNDWTMWDAAEYSTGGLKITQVSEQPEFGAPSGPVDKPVAHADLGKLPSGAVVLDKDGDAWAKNSAGDWEHVSGPGGSEGTSYTALAEIWGPFKTDTDVPSDAEPAASSTSPTSELVLGDTLSPKSTLEWTQVPVGAVLGDKDGDSWTKTGDEAWDLNYASGDFAKVKSNPNGSYGPFTVLYSPNDAAQPTVPVAVTGVQQLHDLPDGSVVTTGENKSYKKVDGHWKVTKTDSGWTGDYTTNPLTVIGQGNVKIVTDTSTPPTPAGGPPSVPDATIPGVQLLGANGVAFKKGDRVKHPTFGMGTVKTIENQGTHAKVVFDNNTTGKAQGVVGKKLTKVNSDGTPSTPSATVPGPNGSTVTPTAPKTDPSSPWYGQPAPKMPQAETVDGTYVPDGWLEEAGVYYQTNSNPNKTIQESHYWPRVDAVIKNGDRQALNKLLDRGVIGTDLHAQALEKINSMESEKAKVLATNAAAQLKFEHDIRDWRKANGLADSGFDKDSFVLKGMDGAIEEHASAAEHRWGKYHQKNVVYSSTALSGLKSYTGSSFDMNSVMHADKQATLLPDYVPSSAYAAPLYAKMKVALSQAGTFQADEIVVRGAYFNEFYLPNGQHASTSKHEWLAQVKPGMTVQNFAFGSYAVGKEPPKSNNFKLRLRVPKGTKGMFVGNGSGISGFPEREIILPPGMTLYIHGVHYSSHGNSSGGPITVDAEVVPNGWTPEIGAANEAAAIAALQAAQAGAPAAPAGPAV